LKPYGQAVINSPVGPTAFSFFKEDVREHARNTQFTDETNRFPEMANTKLKNAKPKSKYRQLFSSKPLELLLN